MQLAPQQRLGPQQAHRVDQDETANELRALSGKQQCQGATAGMAEYIDAPDTERVHH